MCKVIPFENCQKSAKRDAQPFNFQHAYETALDCEEKGMVNTAVFWYREIIKHDPSGSIARFCLIYLLCKVGRYEDAAEESRRAIIANPTNVKAHFLLGCVLESQLDADAAIVEYKTALMLDSGFADAHFNLAQIYTERKQYREAFFHWERYHELDPLSEWGRHAQKRITHLNVCRRAKFQVFDGNKAKQRAS